MSRLAALALLVCVSLALCTYVWRARWPVSVATVTFSAVVIAVTVAYAAWVTVCALVHL